MTSGPASDRQFRTAFLVATLGVGLALAFVFSTYPGLDLAISSAVRGACSGDERHSGWCHENGVLAIPRYAALAFSIMCCGVALAIMARTRRQTCEASLAKRARCAFLLAVFAIGPGLVANVGLKDHWGRARPREVTEFGGARHFTPPLVPARQCVDNCSFVSGEAAAAYTPFFAAALLFPLARLTLVGCGVLFGIATGLVRVSTGAHFISDVLFAGVFMALAVVLAHFIFYSPWTRRVLARANAILVSSLQHGRASTLLGDRG